MLLLGVTLLAACGDSGGSDEVVTCPSDCPANFCLEDGTCSAALCTGAGTCPTDQYCATTSSTTMRCLTGCESGTQCSNGKLCNDSNTCSQDCDDSMAATACQDGVCLNGSCVIGCTMDSDCGLGSGTFCQPQVTGGSKCVRGCKESTNCPTSQTCDASKTRCVECVSDADCAGNKCLTDINLCIECLDDAGCGLNSGYYCDTGSGTCIQGCRFDISCPLGQTCNTTNNACE